MTATVDSAVYDHAVARLFARRPDRLVRGLERITPLAAALDHPAGTYRSVHVTATNGKTSLSHMAAAVLRAHRRRTGCFTSPHLQDVRERVRVDGAPIDPGGLLAGLQRLDAHLDEVAAIAGSPPTFFESMTAVALRHFADVQVDVAVLEVGRGGGLDATNVVDGDVAVIGTVGLDHPELGATVEAVAAEKAGVISPGAVVICGPQPREAGEAIARAATAHGAQLRRWGHEVGVRTRRPAPSGQHVSIATPAGAALNVLVPLRGPHQAANAALAVAAAEAHLGQLDPHATATAFAELCVPGRMEVVARAHRPTVWLDVAHNPPAMRVLARALRPVRAAGPVVGVLGVRGDKDVEGLAAALAPAVDALVVVPSPCPPLAPLARLVAAARRAGHEPVAADDVGTAVACADGLAGGEGIVAVTGSLATVGAARTNLGLPVV